jgi:hypothetical protein
MDLLKQRLTHLWLRQSTLPVAPYPEQGVFPNRMGVTSREPMYISGTMLLPGRYVFRLVDPGIERNHVEIFNEDRTRLVAEITPVLDS